MSKSSFCFYLMLQQTCCMHSLASKLGCYVSIHMHKYQEFIQVNLRISKVPSYWRWSPLIKSCSFSDEPPYSRTPLIRDSRVPVKSKRKIKAKTFQDHNSQNIIKRHQILHDKCYQLPPSKSTTYRHSFFPKTISEWNELSDSVVSADSLDIFKSRLQISKSRSD